MFLETWDRHSEIFDSIATLVDDSNRNFQASDKLWCFTLDQMLAYVHSVRLYFLSNLAPKYGEGIAPAFQDGEGRIPLANLDELRDLLKQSGQAVRGALEELLQREGELAGGHLLLDSPAMFMQRTIWHEAHYAGKLFLTLELNGVKLEDGWENEFVWCRWSTETW